MVEARFCNMMVLDTDFLIDLQRERIRGQPGPAHHFLSEHPDEQFAISVITMLEFLEGYANARDGEDFLESFDGYSPTSRW